MAEIGKLWREGLDRYGCADDAFDYAISGLDTCPYYFEDSETCTLQDGGAICKPLSGHCRLWQNIQHLAYLLSKARGDGVEVEIAILGRSHSMHKDTY